MKILLHSCHKGTGRRLVATGAWPFCQISVALALCLLAAQVQADSFRCGRKVVRSGDAQSRVLQACGEPLRRDSAQELIWSGSKQKTVRVKRWYYKKSSRSLERIVSIYQGKVISVRTGGR